MADAGYFIQSLGLAGFRAYLRPKTFDLSKKPCLAIFAPNGYGKSSVIDALEFMFSKEGTLDRLGLRMANNNAGPMALAHNLAEEAGVQPGVAVSFIKGKDVSHGTRPASGASRPMPAIVAVVNGCFLVNPVIRGHALRRFVESQSPEERYADIATWLQLGPLVESRKSSRIAFAGEGRRRRYRRGPTRRRTACKGNRQCAHPVDDPRL